MYTNILTYTQALSLLCMRFLDMNNSMLVGDNNVMLLS